MWTQEKVCIYKGFHTIHTDNTCCSVVCTCMYVHTHTKNKMKYVWKKTRINQYCTNTHENKVYLIYQVHVM